jgi:NADH:ubiquinone oxidoreductase subunit 3 (subunit A)
MGDVVILYLLQNILIFGVIFWGLTWGSEYFFSKKNHLSTKQFYECGFKSLSDLNMQINLNFSMICVFLILYDIEFTLLYPIVFNLLNSSVLELVFLFFFIFLIILSLLYDWQMNALNWQY